MFGLSKKDDAPKAGSRMADKAQKPKTVMRHDPPEPSGIAFAPWSPRVSEYEVAGQLNRSDSTTRMLRSSLKLSGKGEQDLPAILVPDPDHRAPGRGAHLHPTTECWELAVRRRAFPRALRSGVPLADTLLADHLNASLAPSTSPQHRPETGARSS